MGVSVVNDICEGEKRQGGWPVISDRMPGKFLITG